MSNELIVKVNIYSKLELQKVIGKQQLHKNAKIKDLIQQINQGNGKYKRVFEYINGGFVEKNQENRISEMILDKNINMYVVYID